MSSARRFTCEEAFRRLDSFLDRELAPPEMELVREHLDICEGCAREFAFEESVIRNVRAKLRQIEVPPELAARVLQLASQMLGDDAGH